MLWSGCVIAHHSSIRDHCFFGPSVVVSGKVVVKNNCFIRLNATIRDHVIIEDRCIIGCGSVIKKNTIKDGVYSFPGTELFYLGGQNTKV